jgi:hypothetical protein
MTRLRSALRALRLWPGKRERKKAVQAAAGEKEESLRRASRARELEREIRQIAEANHFAEVIADQLIQRGWKRAR